MIGGNVGRILEIREFCLHDGPGPRTTVFLQGCPLRCRWCQNPEGRDFGGGVERSVDEAVEEISKTADFLMAAGGGVTFSGGEPLGQAEFLLAIVNGLRKRWPEMDFAIETSGFADGAAYQKVIGEMSLVLQDVKLPNLEGYRKWTGIDAAPIFRNLEWLKQSNKRFIARIPTMPGVNDSPSDRAKFAELLSGASGLERVELLPYNSLAGSKYAKLGLQYEPGFDEGQTPDLSVKEFAEKEILAIAM